MLVIVLNLVEAFPTFQVNLKGHDGKVSSLCWSNDDQRLVSCAEDGSLYEWDVPTGQVSPEQLSSRAPLFSSPFELES